MKSIKEKLTELIHYFNANRQIGHTSVMLDGSNHSDNTVIIVHTHDFGESLKKRVNEHTKIVTINELERLRGIRKPMVLDNGALYSLFCDAVHQISKLESQIQKLENKKTESI